MSVWWGGGGGAGEDGFVCSGSQEAGKPRVLPGTVRMSLVSM